ncbi:MAG: hypothetical protein HFE42_02815 [Clostridia bacterium]|nr:hypothetical protein [Clostridia bacterium]
MKIAFTSILFSLILCVTVSFTGCGNEFAKQEYNDDEKIVQIADRYAKNNSVFNPIEGGYSLTASQFDGRETLWEKKLEDNAEIEIQIDLNITSGNAKVVFIDSNNDITVLIERLQNDSNEQTATKTVSLINGLNRLKIVGYDCENIDLKLFFDEP